MKKYLKTEFEELFTPKYSIRILNPQKNLSILGFFLGFFEFFGFFWGCTRISF